MKLKVIFLCLCAFIFAKDFSIEFTEYSKFGFNHSPIDYAKGTYPTESFGTIYSAINYNKMLDNGFSFGASFAFGGLIFDDTKNNPDTKGGLAYKYVGYNSGFLGNIKATPSNTQNYFIKDLYFGYKNDSFSIQIGRFLLKSTEWLTGRHAAIEMHYKKGITDNYITVSEKKSSYGGKWLKTYRFINGTKMPAVIIGSKITPKNFLIHTYLQFQLTRYIAPGIHLGYKKNISQKLSSHTDFYILAPFHFQEGRNKLSSYDTGDAPIIGMIDPKNPYLYGYQGRKAGKGGVVLTLKQSFDISSETMGEHNLGFQLYGTINNPNAFVGNNGNPIGIDAKDNTIYDRGTANNGLFDPDSFSAIFFWAKKGEKYTIKVLNRTTTSRRVFEESLSIGTTYNIAKNLNIGINLTIFEVYTHKNYKIYKTYLQHSRWDDRSFISTYITHSF
ncbi:outer membrane family protein [Helicobacter anatolicus]|uniref:outer membrane family protein n=1 Tax=Helicobacter anatolicus TaxID=2905874 RepID=UPI001E3EE5A1|nr:outer membrane family protein [Helicobacter anatolicus]MCE3039638.1 outer membrane family protein [Helicobacter anatolicus]